MAFDRPDVYAELRANLDNPELYGHFRGVAGFGGRVISPDDPAYDRIFADFDHGDDYTLMEAIGDVIEAELDDLGSSAERNLLKNELFERSRLGMGLTPAELNEFVALFYEDFR